MLRSARTTGFAALALTAILAGQGHAAFSSKGKQTVTASAVLTQAGTIAIQSVAIKNISNNATATTVSWTNVTLPTAWKVADQYIALATQMTTSNGGVQVYTDNTNASASPKYTGVVSSVTQTPAGLVDGTDTTQKLPTAWRGSSFTLTGVNPIDPNAKSGESYLWFFHEDKAQVANNQGATTFTNADPFVTLYAAPATTLTDSLGNSTYLAQGGLHFAQDPTSFGGFQTNATTYIYSEANFSTALTPRTYGTNQLVLEAFTL